MFRVLTGCCPGVWISFRASEECGKKMHCKGAGGIAIMYLKWVVCTYGVFGKKEGILE